MGSTYALPINLPKLRKGCPNDCLATDPRGRYTEGEVNIHFRSPIRREEKEYVPEDELRKRQEDQVNRIKVILIGGQSYKHFTLVIYDSRGTLKVFF